MHANYYYTRYRSSGVLVFGHVCEVEERVPLSNEKEQDWRVQVGKGLTILEAEKERKLAELMDKDQHLRLLTEEREEMMEKMKDFERRK